MKDNPKLIIEVDPLSAFLLATIAYKAAQKPVEAFGDQELTEDGKKAVMDLCQEIIKQVVENAFHEIKPYK